MNTTELARNKWHEILPRLGVDRKYLTNKHGPCPMCGGKDRFRFTNLNGEGYFFCNSCGTGNGFELVMRLFSWTYPDAAKSVEQCLTANDIKQKVQSRTDSDLQLMIELWKRSRPIEESLVANKYFEHRNVPYGNPLGVMRFVTKNETTIILCKVTGPDDTSCQIHRTYLDKDGCKIGRALMKGALPKGSGIRLFTPLANGSMGIAEGVETAISAFHQFGIPTWSLISAPNLIHFNPPRGVTKLTVFGDNDESFTGQAAAYQLANRIKKTGIEVDVLIPPVAGTDWNDYPLQNYIR